MKGHNKRATLYSFQYDELFDRWWRTYKLFVYATLLFSRY